MFRVNRPAAEADNHVIAAPLIVAAVMMYGQRRASIIVAPTLCRTQGFLRVPATAVNKRYATKKLRIDYAHVGLMDVADRTLWIARRRMGSHPARVSHARMIVGGSDTTGAERKDRFFCYWFHTPGSGDGPVHGYPIEWNEGHLMVRLDPNWDYRGQKLLRPVDSTRIERNIDQQFAWGRFIFEAYLAAEPGFPLSWHLIGPRPVDSMFHIQRVESL